MSLIFAAFLAAAGVQASDAPPATPALPGAAPPLPSAEQRVAQSASIGRLLYLFDRAAWTSTDAVTATVAKDQLTGVGGYVVELADPQTLRVTYYRGAGDSARAFFVADVRAGQVVRKELLATPVALSADQAILARARTVAAARAVERAYKPCTAFPFNTVVLPSRNGGPIAVYLLSAMPNATTYPMGGNYRVVVASDGSVVASRPYTVSCLNVPIPKLPAGAKPVGVTVTHLLDPVPTEIHVFASYSLRMPVIVATSDKQVWVVQGSSITPAKFK